jgi:outer membrane usher protein
MRQRHSFVYSVLCDTDQYAGQAGSSDAPFYASSALLASGLQTFSAQMGAARRTWGLLSDNYGNPAASVITAAGCPPR